MSLEQKRFSIEKENTFAKIFLYASFVLIGIINTFLGPILPFLNEKWQLNDVRAGYFLAAQGLGGIIGTFFTSFLYARLSSKTILAVGYTFIIVSLFGLSSNIWQVGYLASFVSGLGLGVVIPTTTLVISKIAGENRAAAINLLNFFWALGAVLSPLIFFIISSPIQLNYLLASIAVIGAAFLICLFQLENIRILSDEKKSRTSGGEKTAILFSSWVFILTIFLQVGIETSLSGWLPTFAKRITSSDWWLLVPTFYWSGFLLSRLASSFYLRLISERAILLPGFLLVIIGHFIFLFTFQINIAAIGAFLVGFGTAPIFPVIIAVLSGKFEKKAPELLSYMFLLSGLSGMIFPWLIGYVASTTGELKSALLIPLMCGFILFFLHFLLRGKH